MHAIWIYAHLMVSMVRANTFLQRGSVVVCFTKRSINAFAVVLFLDLAVADLLSAVQNRE